MVREDNELPRINRLGALSDGLLALAMAILLAIGWSVSNWADLSRMILPDADDMVRLAQVRDWIAGQAMNDWTQYRMAPPNGAPMHWSRINDIGIAAIILAVTPVLGTATAELVAILAYPTLLFAVSLFLSARIARRLWGAPAGFVAVILSAIAYPGITLFLPGRLDHHGLQVITVQLVILALMRAPSSASGAAAGAAMAVGMMIGLEAAPQYGGLIAILFLFWVVRGGAECLRLGAFSGTLAGGTLLFLATMRPTYWTASFCDAFTPASATALIAASVALGVLATATPRLRTWRVRLIVGSILGGIALVGTLAAYPACITGPYGAVDPFLMKNFIAHIDEANSIFEQSSLSRMIGLSGLILMGCATLAWRARNDPRGWTSWAPIASAVVISASITLFQVRGLYIGVPLLGSVLAGLVLAARKARRARSIAIVLAWIASSGIAYHEIPRAIERASGGDPVARGVTPQDMCRRGDIWAQLDRYPAGVVMAPTNMASYLIGATHHATIGAGYHRNDEANMAMYRYFLSSPAAARTIALKWQVDYVLFCPGDFAEMQLAAQRPSSVAAMLGRGETPTGLKPLPLRDARLRLYRVMP